MFLVLSQLLFSLIQIEHPDLRNAEILYQAGKVNDARGLFTLVLKNKKLSNREKAIAALRISGIEGPRFVLSESTPRMIAPKFLHTLKNEDILYFEKEIYGLIRWATMYRKYRTLASLSEVFLAADPSTVNRVRTLYLLGLSFTRRGQPAQAKWFFVRTLAAQNNSQDKRVIAVADLARLNLARLERVEGNYHAALSWAKNVSANGAWVFHATSEAMWNQFELGRKKDALASGEAVNLIVEGFHEDVILPPGTRELAFEALLVRGYIYLSQKKLTEARSMYLLALEKLRIIRERFYALAPAKKVWEQAGLSMVNPFRAKDFAFQNVQEWLPARDYLGLVSVFDDALVVIDEIKGFKNLKKKQRKLAFLAYDTGLKTMNYSVASLSLRAQLGLENTLWQRRVDSLTLRRNMKYLKKKQVDMVRERVDDLKK